jgi:hypothetical protein
VVGRHVAQVEAWCDEHVGGAGADAVADPDAGTSPAFRAMLAHPEDFDGYRIADGANRHAVRYHFEAPTGLYGAGRAGEYLDAAARRTLCAAAAGELLRCAGDPAYAAHTAARVGGPFVTVEAVAARFLGYPDYPDRPADARAMAYADWRRPLAAAEAAACDCVPPHIVGLLARWLRTELGCAPARHLGVRFPPCFVGLLADVVTEQLATLDDAAHDRLAWCSPRVLDAGIAAGRSRTEHYPRWLLHGRLSLEPPSADELTRGWDGLDRAALADSDGAFTAGFRAAWAANHPGPRPVGPP